MSGVTGGPGFSTALSADLAHLGMQVTPENIVHVSNVLRAESDYLATRARWARNNCVVGEPGKDPVSSVAADGFNRKIRLLLDQCQAYCDRLGAASDDLARTAKTYGHTDDDIARSLTSIQANYGQPTTLMVPPPASSEAAVLKPYLPSPAPPIGDFTPLAPKPDDWWEPLPARDGAPR